MSKGSYKYIDEPHKVQSALAEIANYPDLSGLDTESTDLNPRDGKIRLTQIGSPERKAVVFDHFKIGNSEELIRDIQKALQGKRIIAHNAQHDGQWYGETITDCTRIAAKVADCGDFDRYDLGTLAARFLDVVLPKDEQKSNWGRWELTKQQKDYAAKDAMILPPMFDRAMEAVRKADQEKIYKLESGLLPVNMEMNREGFRIDFNNLRYAENLARPKMEQARRELIGLLEKRAPKVLRQADLFSRFAFNPASSKQLLEAFQEAGVVDEDGNIIRSTDKSTLKAVDDPLAPLALLYRKHKIRLSYAKSWREKAHLGKIHPTFDPLKSTGRYGCKDPNVQQVAREEEWRRCFTADEGYELTVADQSQIELRTGAIIMNIQPMLQAYLNDVDVHSYMAAKTVRVPYEQFRKELKSGKPIAAQRKIERFKAKAQNFGFLYGMGWRTFKIYARVAYGVEFTDVEAQAARRTFMDTWVGVETYHRRCVKDCEANGNYVYTRLGRKRYLRDPSVTVCANTPVQGTAGDGMKLAMLALWHKFKAYPEIVIKAVVHDEIIVQHPIDMREFVSKTLRETMEHTMGLLLPGMPVVAEPSSGFTWGDAK